MTPAFREFTSHRSHEVLQNSEAHESVLTNLL